MQDMLVDIAQTLRQLNAVEFWLGFSVVVVVACYLFWRMVRWFQHARLIENIPTARIRSAPQGYVELMGEARMMEGPAIVSPLSGTRCTWYHYKIEEKVRDYDGKGHFRSRWRVVKQHYSDDIFLLIDETGECAIDPDQAQVITRDTRVWHNHNSIPPRRYTERTILENERLYAIGWFKTVASVADQTIRQQVSMKLREWKNDPDLMLHRYDADRDGEISIVEWEKARANAMLSVKKDIGQHTKMKQLSILRQSPHKSQPYILSTVAERSLIARYKRRALAAMLGFIFLGTALVWAVNQRMVV